MTSFCTLKEIIEKIVKTREVFIFAEIHLNCGYTHCGCGVWEIVTT